jgi:hypothetical protein
VKSNDFSYFVTAGCSGAIALWGFTNADVSCELAQGTRKNQKSNWNAWIRWSIDFPTEEAAETCLSKMLEKLSPVEQIYRQEFHQCRVVPTS